MFKKYFTSKRAIQNDEIVSAVVTQTSVLIGDLQKHIDFRFKELSAQLKEVELGLAQLETKLLTKDLKDKQAYGILHYKLHEVKNEKLSDEITSLKDKLNLREALQKKNDK